LIHAKSIKADVVLVYSKYASKRSSISTLQTIKEAAKTTGEIDAEVLEGDEEQYKYYASYWAKLPMPLLGLHVIKLKHKEKDSDVIVDEDGLKVLAVIKNSPAFKAGIKRGDVLLKVGSVDVQTPALLSKAVGKYAGKTVKIAYKRQDELASTDATLNSR
jgi:predicted metalloprotease with PDZ domain